jgi:hypothetical protein
LDAGALIAIDRRDSDTGAVIEVARRYDATVISPDRADLEVLDPTTRVVDC